MIQIENVQVEGFKAAIRGMRNPMNSWDRSDSHFYYCDAPSKMVLGKNDQELMMKLAANGPVHAKFRRMIVVSLDITAPLYWWKEFDTYKVGTVANSCSTMHKIHAKPFELNDFSHEHLDAHMLDLLKAIIDALNNYREMFINYNPDDHEINGCPSKKDVWWQMIQMLPSSYNQRRTVMFNYEVLAGIYPMRKEHKLDEWVQFCKWIESLPYSEIITGKKS